MHKPSTPPCLAIVSAKQCETYWMMLWGSKVALIAIWINLFYIRIHMHWQNEMRVLTVWICVVLPKHCLDILYMRVFFWMFTSIVYIYLYLHSTKHDINYVARLVSNQRWLGHCPQLGFRTQHPCSEATRHSLRLNTSLKLPQPGTLKTCSCLKRMEQLRETWWLFVICCASPILALMTPAAEHLSNIYLSHCQGAALVGQWGSACKIWNSALHGFHT